MKTFDEILGQKAIKEHFITAMKEDKISHAYILNGEEGCLLYTSPSPRD